MNPAPGLLQFFESVTSTYTYLLFDHPGGAAVLVDPVDTAAERDMGELERLSLTLTHILETHVHADHVTSAALLRKLTGAAVVVPAGAGVAGADREVTDGDDIRFGDASPIRVFATPGHTDASASYFWNGCLFTGDALFVDGCGRTAVTSATTHASVAAPYSVIPSTSRPAAVRRSASSRGDAARPGRSSRSHR